MPIAPKMRFGSEIPYPKLVCGVYFLFQDEEVGYVGQSVNIYGRITGHLEDKVFNRVTFLEARKPKERLRLENYWIQLLKPRYNKTWQPKDRLPDIFCRLTEFT